jgi:SAM-dependent methyltransferase
MVTSFISKILTRLPAERRERMLWRLQRIARPARLGTLRRTTPLSDLWGYDRGTPVDRYYIEQFLEHYRQDIRGRVLEIRDNEYSMRYGAAVERSDVLDINPRNTKATIICDLAAANTIATASFDCFILTQTLQFIYDVRAAAVQAHRILRPGGVLLCTLPGISRFEPPHVEYWRFTPETCAALFHQTFDPQHTTIHSYGNMLTAIASLAGMAREELAPHELAASDKRFPVVVAMRAVKQ